MTEQPITKPNILCRMAVTVWTVSTTVYMLLCATGTFGQVSPATPLILLICSIAGIVGVSIAYRRRFVSLGTLLMSVVFLLGSIVFFMWCISSIGYAA